MRATFGFAGGAAILQDMPDTLVLLDGEPAQVLRALGYFEDGDLASLDKADQNLLRNARDKIQRLPGVVMKSGSLTGR
jgi:hypothetical protein